MKTPLPTRLSQFSKIRAVFADPAVHDIAAMIPTHRTGRPREQPDLLLAAGPLLANIFGNVTAMIVELEDPDVWRVVVEALAEHLPAEELPTRPPTPRQITYFRDTYLTTDAAITQIRRVLWRTALRLHDGWLLGAHSPDQRITLASVLQADGTTIASIYKAALPVLIRRPDGTVRVGRFDGEAAQFRDGALRDVVGHKFTIISARVPDNHRQRVIMDVACVPPGHEDSDEESEFSGEGAQIIRSMQHLTEAGLRTRALVYDGALRGAHVNEIGRTIGIPVINDVAAASTKEGERVEKERLFDVVERCGARTPLVASQGAVHRKVVTAAGEAVLEPLRRGKVLQRANKEGTHRLYATYYIPCQCSKREHEKLISLLTGEQDERRGFNRAEMLRAYPKGDPVYDAVYKRGRAEIESVNSQVQADLHNGRSRTKGRNGTHLEVLASALVNNAIARYEYGASPPIAAAA